MKKKNFKGMVVLLIALLILNMMPTVYAAGETENVTSGFDTLIYFEDGTVAYCINPPLSIPNNVEYTEIDFTEANIKAAIDFETYYTRKAANLQENPSEKYRDLGWILQEGYPNKTTINGITLSVEELKEVTNCAIAYVMEKKAIDNGIYSDRILPKVNFHNAHKNGTDPVSRAYQYLINTRQPDAETLANVKLYKSTRNQYAYDDQYIVTFKATPQTTSVQVTKAWTDENGDDLTWPADVTSVTVTLYEDGTETNQTVTLTQDAATKSFDNLPTGKTYTVQETPVDGYTGTVTDNGDNTFTVTNKKDKVVTLKLDATKTLDNGTLRGGQFSFELKDADGNVLQTKSNDADGKIAFDTITYSASDFGKTFDYTVSEKNEGTDGVTYDETVYTVKVTIDAQGNLTYKMYKVGDGPAESVTDDKTYTADHFRPQGSGNNHCLAIDDKVAYCFNLVKDWPWIDEESPIDSNLNKNEGYKKLENVSNGDMGRYSNGATKDEVLKVIYNGYPYDNAGLKAKYNLTDDQFRAVTQVALWYYTEGAYANVDDSMTEQQRWNNTFMIINRGVGAYGIQGEGNFWEGADDVTKANMYKCMADLTGATVKYSQGTGFNANSVFYRGNTESLQEPAGNLTVDLFVHPTDDAAIDEEEKVQNLLSVGTVNPAGGAAGAAGQEEVAAMTFENSIEPTADDKVGTLIITKTIEGDVTAEEAEGAITFKVTAPDGTETEYTLDKFTKDENGKYTLTLSDVVIGNYKVEETTKDITGKTVTVKYTVNSGNETTGDNTTVEVTKDQTATVDFNNSYVNDKGNLVITKSIEGDVTAEEAEGAITFTVTAPDGNETEYTLDDFKNEDGKYTLELNDVLAGEYTVEETTKDITGKTVTVTYTVNSGNETTGDNTTVEVTKDQTATVDFNNSYVNDRGNLVITKTIEGDVTAEEAEGAITFKVTAPDGTSTEYTLDKFTKDENGKYTLELNDVLVGEYTVEETTKDIDGKAVTVTYKVNSGTETTGDNTTVAVTKDQTATVDFNNSYANDKGNLVITKTIEGDVTPEEAEGAITFKVTAPDGTETEYTLDRFTKDENGKYTLTLSDVVIGNYKVEETTKDITGKTVTVKYTVNSGNETTGDNTTVAVTKDQTATVDFNNSYVNDKGNLVITKTIEGDVTAEEAEGAITFKVTAPDGTETEYTLDKFTKDEDGKYTLTLSDVVIGNYKVEETTKDITGKTVTVKYTVNSGNETTGDSATAAVTKDQTTTVDFNNSYVNDRGNLVITKTIEGDVTPEEAEGAITFTVTAPDGASTEYTLDKFTKDEDGKYTLALNDVLVGEYIVEETTKDITGKTVTVKYTVNSGTETTGDNTTVAVTKDQTTTVDFNDSYVNHKGNLVITKTIEGDVTPEEAEGAITFKVTAPDGTSKEYTLDKFTKDENGKYTLTLSDVVIGNYKVEETTKDIDGKAVTVSYTVNSGNVTAGDNTTVAVTKDETTNVDFKNNYSNDKGTLVITKTIEGDVTQEEAEGAITFKVTAPDGTSKEYTLDKFTKDEDGKYTLTLSDIVIGNYTVEETTKDIDGKTVTVKYTVNSGNETIGDNTTASVTKDQTTTVDFNNSYVNDRGNLVITKTIEGDVTQEEAEGAITFTVTAPDGTSKEYTLDKFTKGEDGKYTLALNDVLVGEYTVEETTKDIDGKTVTVKYTVNSGNETTGDNTTAAVTKDQTTTVDFNNSYVNDRGNLVITKTIEGDVTEEEAEGAITFTVTAPDGTSTEYTLDKFTKGEDGKYTLALNDVLVGEYTVEETTKDIDGKTVTVKYTVNSGNETTGDNTTAAVTKDQTTTVDFNNSYVNDRGSLVITKTIEGDVTPEEAEGVITFTVTAPDGTSKEYTLDKFTKGEDGKYTLELNDVLVGNYTVEETTKDIDGKTVTVKYTVNSGNETTGDNTTAAVTKDQTTTVDFNNNYVNDKGTLVITKTLKGDVTAEEAEGALTFKVTAPDGTSKEYTLADFTKDEDGKYTLTLDNVLIGEYTVEETTSDIDGKTVTVKYSVNGGDATEGTATTATVAKDETATVDFENDYVNDKGNLVITKTIEGDVTAEEAEGTLTFKVTAPDGTSKEYTLADFTKDEDGKYTLTLDNVLIGEYTVEETTSDIDGKTVTVKYSVNGGDATEGTATTATVAKDETATVDFENDYVNDKGNLVITKTLKGDVTAEEAEGALTFKVTAPDGTSKEYTLADFTKGEDGKYTLELNDVLVGEYTVEETTSDIDGKTVTVKYSVNGGDATDGTATTATVTKDGTTTVDFENDYVKTVTVAISKVDLGGKPLAGAHIVVTDKDGNVVEDYTSTTEVKTVTVAPGTYTFHEETAPTGYKVVTDFTFTVDVDGTITVNGVDTSVAKFEDGKLVVTDEDLGGEEGEDNPGDNPGEDNPGEDNPGENPGGDNPGGNTPGEQPGGDDQGDKPGEKPSENPSNDNSQDKPVETGDDTDIMTYVMLMELSMAACAMVVLTTLRKKRNSNC